MKQILLSTMIIATLLFSFNACAQNRVTASKNYTTKEVKVNSFNSIRIQGSQDVVFTQASNRHVEIYASDNVIDLMDVYAEDGTLVVKFKKGVSIMNSGKIEVRVSNPTLANVSIQGSGDFKLTNGIKGEQSMDFNIQGSGDIQGSDISCGQFGLSIQGSGDIALGKIDAKQVRVQIQGSGDVTLSKIEAEQVDAQIHGSGDVALSGKCNEANFSIAGSGDISAENLKSERTTASTNGSGDLRCHANQYLKAHVNGSGSIGYRGNPSQTDFSKKGVHKL